MLGDLLQAVLRVEVGELQLLFLAELARADYQRGDLFAVADESYDIVELLHGGFPSYFAVAAFSPASSNSLSAETTAGSALPAIAAIGSIEPMAISLCAAAEAS